MKIWSERMNQSYLIKPLLDEHYPIVDFGKGVYLFDMEGKKYFDASSGAVTANIGHGVAEIIEAIQEQATKYPLFIVHNLQVNRLKSWPKK